MTLYKTGVVENNETFIFFFFFTIHLLSNLYAETFFSFPLTAWTSC